MCDSMVFSFFTKGKSMWSEEEQALAPFYIADDFRWKKEYIPLIDTKNNGMIMTKEKEEEEEGGIYKNKRRESDNNNNNNNNTFIYENSVCFLCMGKVLYNAEDIVIPRCHEICKTVLHYTCINNSLWPYHGHGIICPVCTKDEHVFHPYRYDCEETKEKIVGFSNGDIRSRLLKKKLTKGEWKFLCVMRTFIDNIGGYKYCQNASEGQMKVILKSIENEFARRTLSVSIIYPVPRVFNDYYYYIRYSGGGGGGGGDTHHNKGYNKMKKERLIERGKKKEEEEEKYSVGRLIPKDKEIYIINNVVSTIINYTKLSGMLRKNISISCIYDYFTKSIEGLVLMGLRLKDIKEIEKADDIENFVSLYNVTSDKLRFYLGEKEMNLQKIIECSFSPKTLYSLGITVHELCIMGMKKEDIPLFNGYRMEEWIFYLRMSRSIIRVLRLQTEDFISSKKKKGGDGLMSIGWDIKKFIHYMNLTPKEVKDLKLQYFF
jgi:hypothetical protein